MRQFGYLSVKLHRMVFRAGPTGIDSLEISLCWPRTTSVSPPEAAVTQIQINIKKKNTENEPAAQMTKHHHDR